ncbi:hypothetical protein M3Y97_01122000 [Aphelenchoides bicaudatus]|nr:hypothetical protein M3Y97_01122000 [Aphelenchoides bicaudatus]
MKSLLILFVFLIVVLAKKDTDEKVGVLEPNTPALEGSEPIPDPKKPTLEGSKPQPNPNTPTLEGSQPMPDTSTPEKSKRTDLLPRHRRYGYANYGSSYYPGYGYSYNNYASFGDGYGSMAGGDDFGDGGGQTIVVERVYISNFA